MNVTAGKCSSVVRGQDVMLVSLLGQSGKSPLSRGPDAGS